TCVSEAYKIGAGMPLKNTCVPARLVSTKAEESGWNWTSSPGPIPEPCTTTVSPGATGPPRLLAPLVTAVIDATPVGPLACATGMKLFAANIVVERDPPGFPAANRVTTTRPESEGATEDTVSQSGNPPTDQGHAGSVWTLIVKFPPVAGACSADGR